MGLAAATLDAFLATCFTWAVTAAGAALVFVLPPDEATQRQLLRPMLGFAGGVMTSASFFSLLAPALELAEDQLGRRWSFVPVAVGFFLGGAFLYLCDVYMETQQIHDPLELMQDAVLGRSKPKADKPSPRRSPRSSSNPYATPSNARLRRPDALPRVPSSLEGGRGPPQPDDDSTAKKAAAARRAVALLVFAITLHNFPEGLAVGVGFGGAAAGLAGQSRAKAMNLALGIGLQNFPEGLAVSMPLKRAGLSSYKAFLFGQLSGVVEPVGGILGAALVTLVTPILPYALAFAAGAMIYVVVDQLIPESLAGPSQNKQQTLAFMGGFGLMMIMDVALG